MSNYVFVIDSSKQPLSPCHPSVARKLIKQKKATVFRRYPFTIILNKTVETTLTWVKRLLRFAPITGITQELVRFNLQKLENPEISGIEYQQGELQGYEASIRLISRLK